MLPTFWQRFLTEILIWGLLAMSSDILIGYTGMVSFGHSAFFGLGMYGAAAALLLFSSPSLFLALAFGLVASAVVGLFVAYFSTRLRDIYFAITRIFGDTFPYLIPLGIAFIAMIVFLPQGPLAPPRRRLNR